MPLNTINYWSIYGYFKYETFRRHRELDPQKLLDWSSSQSTPEEKFIQLEIEKNIVLKKKKVIKISYIDWF